MSRSYLSKVMDTKTIDVSLLRQRYLHSDPEVMETCQDILKQLGAAGCAYLSALVYYDIKHPGHRLTRDVLGVAQVMFETGVLSHDITVRSWDILYTILIVLTHDDMVGTLDHFVSKRYQELPLSEVPPVDTCIEVWHEEGRDPHFVVNHKGHIIDLINGHSINVARGKLERRFYFKED